MELSVIMLKHVKFRSDLRLYSNSILSAFTEASYTGQKYQGHTFDHPNELFSSATAVLRNWHDQFLSRLDQLKTDEERDLALDIARVTCGYYLEHPNYQRGFFDDKVLDI